MRWLLAACALFALVVAGRMVFVSLFAESVPFWDQWDAEGAFLLKPWVEGTWEWTRLFDPHNEHRIAFTRLIALLLFEANDGQWDNLVSAGFNVFVYAGTVVLAFLLLAPGLSTRLAKVAFFVLLLALAWLPYGFENSLVGFQNQFYLMAAFALLALAVAASGRDNAWLPLKLGAVAVPALFTMASGLLGAVAAVPVLLARVLAGNLRWRTAAASTALLASIAAAGYLAIPHVAGHDALKASEASIWFASFGQALAWPVSKSYKGLWVLWLPTAVALWGFARGRRATPQQIAALGLSGWVLLQCAAIAYSRGGYMALHVGGRYLDTLALGIVANGWLALQLAERVRIEGGGRLGRALPALPLVLLALALALSFLQRTPTDLAGADWSQRISIEQTINVRSYVRSGDPAHLDKPRLLIPYPQAQRLATLLDDPTLRGILPASIREPLPISGDSTEGSFHLLERPVGTVLSSCAPDGDCDAGTGEWQSRPLVARLPYLQIVAGVTGRAQDLALEWSGDAGASAWMPLRLIPDATSAAIVPAAAGGIVLRARDASATSSLRLLPPAEAGRLSALAGRMQQAVRRRAGDGSASRSIWRQHLPSPVGESDMQPLAIAPDTGARFEWNAPRDGRIVMLSLLVGNYVGKADGRMQAEICAAAGCARGTAPLQTSQDNSDFPLALVPALAVSRGEVLTIRLGTDAATHPVALWTFPSVADSVRMIEAPPDTTPALLARTVRLTMVFDD